ncbi:MAG: hypothetical protein AB7T01_02390 [Acidithiobacillus sp.]
MFHKTVLLSAVSLAFAAPAAFASTVVGIGFDNVGIDAGQGNSMTLPGGKLSVSQSLGDHYLVSGNFVGAGGKNDATFYGMKIGAYKSIPFDGGKFLPGLEVGYNRLNIADAHVSAMYAGADVAYRYPLNRDVMVQVDGGVGRDFLTSVTGRPTIGGLAYNAGAQAGFRVGPGLFDVGYQYRHLPLSSGADLHLNTGEVSIGYRVRF